MSGGAAAAAALNRKKKAEGSGNTPVMSRGMSSQNLNMRKSRKSQAGEAAEEKDFFASLTQDLSQDEEKVARFSDQLPFVITIAVAIVVNAIQMGAELQFQDEPWKTVWRVLENLFTAFFLGEMLIKWRKDGIRDYFQFKANCLDCCIVVAAVIDNWILSVVLTEDDKEKLSFLSVMKLVRLARILKLLKMKRELAVLVGSIVNSLSSMIWLCVLLFIIIYTLSICTVQFIGRTDIYDDTEFDNKEYFGDMVAAAVTGLNLALLDGFGDVLRPIIKEQPLYALGILVYVGVASFGIMNAIIGVIVTKTSEAQDELEQLDKLDFQQRQMNFVSEISSIIYAIDVDGDGTVSPEEIEAASTNEELSGVLDQIDLPYNFSLTDLHTMLDKDGDGELTKEEFFTGMRRFIFSNDFHRQCLLSLSIAQQKRKLFEFKLCMDENLADVQKKLDVLLGNAGKEVPCAASTGNDLYPITVHGEDDDEDKVKANFRPPTQPFFGEQPTQPFFGAEGESFEHLLRVDESILENTLALHHKLDALNFDKSFNVDGEQGALVPQQAPSALDHFAYLEENVSALNHKVDALDISDQIAQMVKNFKAVNENLQWMRGALQTSVRTQADANSGTGAGTMNVPSHGPYTIAVTGASLLITTANMPSFSQPHGTQHDQTPALPGTAEGQQQILDTQYGNWGQDVSSPKEMSMQSQMYGQSLRPIPGQISGQMQRPASASARVAPMSDRIGFRPQLPQPQQRIRPVSAGAVHPLCADCN